jgi:hypothetical protein
MTEQEKAFHILQKSFFSLQDELAEYEMAGINPPKHLLQKFEQTKRRLHIFSKALQKIN